MNFWNESPGPFYILAPMEDVTDTVFREVIMSVSDTKILNVLFTEFTSVDGLLNAQGYDKVMQRLTVTESENQLLKTRGTKLVAQIWGNDPEKFMKTAQLITNLGQFDGIDINMGCPVKKVVKSKTCSALILYPELANEIIQATKKGTTLPVSVKTRIGFNTVITETWISNLLKNDLAALTIHGRTQKQMSDGNADWNEIAKAVELRNTLAPETKIIGNGDVDTFGTAKLNIDTYKPDGVMVGRGIFSNPWMFNTTEIEITVEERKRLLIKHTKLFESTWGNQKNFNELKRFYKIYINSFTGAAELRARLMECKNYTEVYAVMAATS